MGSFRTKIDKKKWESCDICQTAKNRLPTAENRLKAAEIF